MTKPIRVLIVDDEEPIRKLLEKGFRSSRQHEYKVVCAESPEECIDLTPPGESPFDVCIIDLGFDSGDPELVGFKMLLGLVSDGITVVYSGHPTVPNVVRAMQLGADDFLPKVDVPPHELVKHVEQLIAERQWQEERRRRIDEYVRKKNGAMILESPGPVLAIVVEETGLQVPVKDGRDRLDALLRYAELRKDHPEWPVDPYLYIVPDFATAPRSDDE